MNSRDSSMRTKPSDGCRRTGRNLSSSLRSMRPVYSARRHVMKQREKFELRKPLVLWSLTLAVF
ncbi:hypothetical protein MHYP_G00107540, partial [Metynnis hypsauchen]